MVGTNALFDTNILIDYLAGLDAAGVELERYQNRAISLITWMEVLAGTKPEYEVETRTFLRSFVILGVTEAIAERTVTLRRLPRLKLPDAIILATAEVSDRLLITRNT